MKIRILKAPSGIIHAHSLSQFLPGFVYDVEPAFGEQLIELGVATEVAASDPVTSVTSVDVDLERLDGGVHVVPPGTAVDRPQRRRRKRP